jgi:hypothetical protein
VVLLDGRSIAQSMVWENARYSARGRWINPSAVSFLTESPARMPARFARMIKSAGESGMGYHIYVVRLADGNSFVHFAGNLAIDLVNLPPGYTHKDIIGVNPHEGRRRAQSEGFRDLSGLDWAPVEFARPELNR